MLALEWGQWKQPAVRQEVVARVLVRQEVVARVLVQQVAKFW